MKLFNHQVEALQATKNFNRVAYYLDMGLGKTYIGSEKMKQLDNRINLVICQKSKVDDWYKHFDKNYPNVAVFDLTNKKEMETFISWSVAQEPAKAAQIVVIGIINYELAFRRPALLNLEGFTLMLDESSIIQNRTTKQAKFILKLRAENVILLSGTPCSGKYENLWSQAHLLGWEIEEKTFLKHYINFKKLDTPIGIKKIIDKENPYRNQERLKAKLRTYGAVFMKTDEVFDLPTQTFINVSAPISKEYTHFMKNDIVTVEENDLIGATQLTKLLYARQLSGQYSTAKLYAFRDLLSSTNDRLIVFYNFDDELEKLSQIARDLDKPRSFVNGHVKDLTCYERCDDSITFVQYQSGSKGLNLQMANKIIYFTPTLSVENWMQSQKRIHRIGQTKPCFYYKLICSGSVEEKIYDALERGVDFTDDLFKEVQRGG